MGVATYIAPKRYTKEAESILNELRARLSEGDLILEELELKMIEIDNSKNEVDEFVVEANEKIETVLDTLAEEIQVTQSDIDDIIAMVGDL